MAHRYAPLPNPSHNRNVSQHERVVEMEAAFDYSDDEDHDDYVSESQPLNGRRAGVAPAQARPPSPPQHSPAGPGVYNFENVDYDFPPPGSPPPPSATALPNNFGNSNGMVPDFSAAPAAAHTNGPWIRRAVVSVLPPSVLSRLGLAQQRPSGPVGGGINNDGVFANVTAKPTAPAEHQDGDEFMAPEDAQREAPPSYASAQADAVPPYWETTIHAPFASDSIGEMIVDNLSTGSLFSFCWNLLVSVAFQFVGFLLTYLLHTSHAARLGSRAGLGITLIQYGFALRGKYEAGQNGENGGRPQWSWAGSSSNSSADGGDNSGFRPHHHHHNPDGSMANVTWSTPMSNLTETQASIMIADATTEWLSFFLMTIGWFVLLTSLLGFWRVKRWERSVIASRNTSSSTSSGTTSAAPQSGRRPAPLGLASQFDSHFGLRGTSRIELLRQGFGFGSNRRQHEADDNDALLRAEEGGNSTGTGERDPMITSTSLNSAIPANVDPARARAMARMLENEVRLQRDLREAGLL